MTINFIMFFIYFLDMPHPPSINDSLSSDCFDDQSPPVCDFLDMPHPPTFETTTLLLSEISSSESIMKLTLDDSFVLSNKEIT